MDLENILNSLEEVIINDLNSHIEDLNTTDLTLDYIDENNVVMFELDIDKNKRSVMLFILPENSNHNRITMDDDEVVSQVSIYVICRDDTKQNLYKKVLRYTKSIFNLLKDNNTLNNAVGDIQVNDTEYYHAVEGNEFIKGSEIVINLFYES